MQIHIFRVNEFIGYYYLFCDARCQIISSLNQIKVSLISQSVRNWFKTEETNLFLRCIIVFFRLYSSLSPLKFFTTVIFKMNLSGNFYAFNFQTTNVILILHNRSQHSLQNRNLPKIDRDNISMEYMDRFKFLRITKLAYSL